MGLYIADLWQINLVFDGMFEDFWNMAEDVTLASGWLK